MAAAAAGDGGAAKRRRVAEGGGGGPARGAGGPPAPAPPPAGAPAGAGAELRAGLEEGLEVLGSALARHQETWEGARRAGGQGAEGGGGAEALLGLAHRLGYTTFAPPGFVPGDQRWGALGPHVPPLGSGQATCFQFCTPPAPQAWHIGASLLYEYAPEVAPTTAEACEEGGVDGPKGEGRTWREGDQLPEGLPPMPEGWQPGMPLPGTAEPPAAEGGGAPALVPRSGPEAETAAAAVAEVVPEKAPPPETGGLPDALRLPATMNFILNPDLEDAEEEESSEEESSDDG